MIRREVLIAPGDVFNTVRVDISKKRLENLGYFSKVETYPEETGVEGRKDLTVQVEEKADRVAQFRRRVQHGGQSGWLCRVDAGKFRFDELAGVYGRRPEVPGAGAGWHTAEGFPDRIDRAVVSGSAAFPGRPGILQRSELSEFGV